MEEHEIGGIFHRTRAAPVTDNGGDAPLSDLSPLSYGGPSGTGEGDMEKRASDRSVSYTAIRDPVKASSSSSGVFWLVVVPLVAQTLLATLILVFFLVYVDQRAFNVIERLPHYPLSNGTTRRVPQKDWVPLQSDITTIISGAFNLLGKLYSGWIALMTWNYAFLLLERNGMRIENLGDMVSLPFIPSLFPPPGYSSEPAAEEARPAGDVRQNGGGRKWLAVGIALVMLTAFPASFSPPIATGSISWHASTRNMTDVDFITGIGGQGANYGNINPYASWGSDPNFRPRYIERATSLAVHSWNSVTQPVDSAPTYKRYVPSVNTLPVGSSLTNVTVPIFSIESFEWITDGSDVSNDQLAYLVPANTPGVLYNPTQGQNPNNPLQSTPGVLALLPDAPWNSIKFPSPAQSVPPSVVTSQIGVVALSVNYAGSCDATTIGIFGALPPGAFTYGAKNQWGYTSCFVFAKIIYSAGAAVCSGCEVVFPLVVQNPPGVTLKAAPDVATQQALYMMSDVIGQLASSNVTMPSGWNQMDEYIKEVLVRGYSSAWTVMSEMIAFYSPLLSTSVTVPIPTSRAFVDKRRLYGWFSLQVLAFVGGLIFLFHIGTADRYPINNPLITGLMLDIDMPTENRRTIQEHNIDTWTEDFKDTFITWKRGEERSAITIKGPMKAAKKPLWRRVFGHCFGCFSNVAATAEGA